MNNLATMEQSMLIDQLAEYTVKYTQCLIAGGLHEDMNNYKEIVEQLQTEIERRKTEFSNNSTLSAKSKDNTI